MEMFSIFTGQTNSRANYRKMLSILQEDPNWTGLPAMLTHMARVSRPRVCIGAVVTRPEIDVVQVMDWSTRSRAGPGCFDLSALTFVAQDLGA